MVLAVGAAVAVCDTEKDVTQVLCSSDRGDWKVYLTVTGEGAVQF